MSGTGRKTALLRRALAMARDDGAVVLEIEASPDVPLALSRADGLTAAKEGVSVSARIRAVLDGMRRAMPSALAVARIVPGVRFDLDDQFYALRFKRLTPREVAYALALADLGDGPHAVHSVAATFRARSQDLSSIRNQLIKKEVLFASAPGMIEFRMPLSARYVQRNRAALDVRAAGVSLRTPDVV